MGENAARVGHGAGDANRALLDACKEGDRDAWRAIVSKYGRVVHAVPLKWGLPEDVAADISQHTFAELARQLHRIEEPQSLGAWLTTVALREVWRLKDRKPTEALPGDLAEDVEDFTELFVRAVAVHEAVHALGRALSVSRSRAVLRSKRARLQHHRGQYRTTCWKHRPASRALP